MGAKGYEYEIQRDNLGGMTPVYDASGAFMAWMTGTDGHYVPLTGHRGLVTLCFRGCVPTDEKVRSIVGPIDRENVIVYVPYRTTDEPGVVNWGLFVLAFA